MITSKCFLASLLGIATSAAFADQAASASAADAANTTISCSASSAISMRQAVLDVMTSQKVPYGRKDYDGFSATLKQSGLPATAEGLSPVSRASVEAESALAARSFIISAKMLHDESMKSPDYKSTPFSRSIARYLATSVEVVQDGGDAQLSADPAVASKAHGREAGLAEVSNALADVWKRVGAVKAGLGGLYTAPEIRYFILGNAFRDPVAIQSAERLICAKHLTTSQIKAVELGGDFVLGKRVQGSPNKGARQ